MPHTTPNPKPTAKPTTGAEAEAQGRADYAAMTGPAAVALMHHDLDNLGSYFRLLDLERRVKANLKIVKRALKEDGTLERLARMTRPKSNPRAQLLAMSTANTRRTVPDSL